MTSEPPHVHVTLVCGGVRLGPRALLCCFCLFSICVACVAKLGRMSRRQIERSETRTVVESRSQLHQPKLFCSKLNEPSCSARGSMNLAVLLYYVSTHATHDAKPCQLHIHLLFLTVLLVLFRIHSFAPCSVLVSLPWSQIDPRTNSPLPGQTPTRMNILGPAARLPRLAQFAKGG